MNFHEREQGSFRSTRSTALRQPASANALVSNLTDYASDGSSPVASEQFAYDGDLRPQTDTATWGSGSGQSGTIWSEGRWYDNAGNVVSLAVTQAAVPGKTGSGGSETENFCYNEQNELVWASNTTAPSPGSAQTCGSQTPGNSLNGGSYTTSYVYTNLGQLWQGPVAGGSTNEQYLYCTSAPHQLSGIYAAGSTCASKSGQQYKDSSYDTWGNVTGRTYNGTSETLAYDDLDRMVKWTINAGTNDYFAYGASGNRTVQRATSSGTTTLTIYAFGLEEYQYSGTGTLQNQTYYYSLGGRLIGELTGLTTLSTNFFLTDALGSVVAAFSNTKGAAALSDNQVYGPYGNLLYSANGSLGTTRGYTGQYSDPLTGLDYYVSRYYDPVAGIFLSADTKEGNAQGMNPYAYVAQNPETLTDPSGQMIVCPPGGCGGPPPPPSPPPPPNHGPVPCTWQGCMGGNSGNNSSPPKQAPRAKTVNVGGIKNGWLFAQGLGEFAIGIAALAAAIGLIVGTDGVGALVEAILPQLEPFLANLQIRGFRDMYASMNDTDPWMRVVLDGLVVITDVWTAVATFKGIGDLIMQGTFRTSFLTRLAQVATAVEAFAADAENGKYSAYRVGIFVQATSALGIFAVNTVGGTYWSDIVEMDHDYQDASSDS